MTQVAIIDDHAIFCDSLCSLINDFDDFSVAWTAYNGQDAINKLKHEAVKAEILLLDIAMPVLNGLDVAKWIHEHQSNTKILALTMEDDDDTVIKMLQFGVKGYLLKNIGADELKFALQQVAKFGYYYTPIITSNIHKSIDKRSQVAKLPELSEREKELISFICTDLSYAEIAKRMFLSESTIDTYRARLFDKFEVRNRAGLMLKTVQLGLVKL